jgi:hypothetical protein
MKNLINWSELSRYITKGDRNCIRANKIPKKHTKALDNLIMNELPDWWRRYKKQNIKTYILLLIFSSPLIISGQIINDNTGLKLDNLFKNVFYNVYSELNIDTNGLSIILSSNQFDKKSDISYYKAIVRKIDNNTFVINIDESLYRSEKIKAFIHELVHISQFQSKQLKIFTYSAWFNGVTYTQDVKYGERPFEVEAIRKTNEVYLSYKKQK